MLRFKELELSDLPEVLFIASSSRLSSWNENMFLEEMRNPYSFCYLCISTEDQSPSICGFICFRIVADESEILNLAVHPERRNVGIGKHLLRFYIDFCLRRAVKSCHLEVEASNAAALMLYRHFQFEYAGVRPRYYQGCFDAIRMIKKL